MHLTRHLIFFDLETTPKESCGPAPILIAIGTTDRIVQIGAIKLLSSGERIEKNYLINSGILDEDTLRIFELYKSSIIAANRSLLKKEILNCSFSPANPPNHKKSLPLLLDFHSFP